jgi:hypothetical protein
LKDLLDLRHERRQFVEPIQDRDPDPVAVKQRMWNRAAA